MSEEHSTNEENRKIDKRDYDILNWMALDEGTEYNFRNQGREEIRQEYNRHGSIRGHRL